jgi:hypothetical protein
VQVLRELLAQTPTDRKWALTAKAEQTRQVLEQKLREFDALSPSEREVRLRLLEVRYYLLQLLRMDPSNRVAQVSRVPAGNRRLVETRLRDWDRLPPEQQREILQQEPALLRFTRTGFVPPPAIPSNLPPMPPDRRKKVEDALAEWRTYPIEQQRRLVRNLQKFFGSSPGDRQKALETLPEAERQETERAMQALDKLPIDQRIRAVEAFQRFATMSPEERSRFLDNALRWQSMSAEERRAWRELSAPQPPLPPGLQPGTAALSAPRSASAGTNAGAAP